MEPRISIITLGVGDLERSRRFYEEGLGLPRRQVGSDGVVFLELKGMLLSLFPREDLAHDATVDAEGAGFRAFTLAHNVATREEVDATLRQAAAAGGRIVKPAQDAFWGGYTGYFADPDGFLWEVAWNPFMPDLAG